MGTKASDSSLRPHIDASPFGPRSNERPHMHGIIYLIGLVVIVLAILSFLGLG